MSSISLPFAPEIESELFSFDEEVELSPPQETINKEKKSE